MVIAGGVIETKRSQTKKNTVTEKPNNGSHSSLATGLARSHSTEVPLVFNYYFNPIHTTPKGHLYK